MIQLIKKANGNHPRSDAEKMEMINEAAKHYGQFLTALGFDWQADENSKKTPLRVAKAWVDDIISGCVNNSPVITDFPNEYTGMVFEGNIDVVSLCSHHNLAFTGKAYVAYLPGDRAIGLSKINRIVDWYARRPQIQEGLTQQIHDHINRVCVNNKGVAVMVVAEHTCCSHRGIKHKSSMTTTSLSGAFIDNKDTAKQEFLHSINLLSK